MSNSKALFRRPRIAGTDITCARANAAHQRNALTRANPLLSNALPLERRRCGRGCGRCSTPNLAHPNGKRHTRREIRKRIVASRRTAVVRQSAQIPSWGTAPAAFGCLMWGSSTASPFSAPAERTFAAHDESLGPGEPSAISKTAAHAHTAPPRRIGPTAHLAGSEFGRRLAACEARTKGHDEHGDGNLQEAHGVLPQRPISTADGWLIRARKGSLPIGEPRQTS